MAVGLVSHGFTPRAELDKVGADWVVDKMEEFNARLV